MATRVRAARSRRTETIIPTDPDGRLEQSFSNSSECAHRFAANTQRYGKSGNTYFSDGVFYSYGSHFPVARHVRHGNGAPFVLFTTRGYSSTTAGHKSDVRRALRGQTVFEVDNVHADTREQHEHNLRDIGERAAQKLATAKRARVYREMHEADAAGLLTMGNAYAEAVGLKMRLPSPEGDNLAEWAAECERKDAARKKKARADEIKRFAVEIAEWEQRLAAWKDGGEHPGQHPTGSGLSYLRVRGSRLETSQRAVIPVKMVMPILEMVRAGTQYKNYAERSEGRGPLKFDGFELREVDHELKTVTLGCHTVAFDEIERVAKLAGL